MSGNQFTIEKIEGIPSLQSIFININWSGGLLEVLSCPYLIITIPKTGYKTVVFKVEQGSPKLPNLQDFSFVE